MPGVVNQGIIQQYSQDMENTSGFILAEFKGVEVADADVFRSDLFQSGSRFRVVKNRLFKVILKDHSIDGLDEICQGSTAAIMLTSDPVATAKVVKDFEKSNKIFKIKAGYLDGQILTSEDVIKLASIPSREVLIAKLLMCLNGPVSGMVNVLSGVLRNAVGVLDAIREKKENTDKD